MLKNVAENKTKSDFIKIDILRGREQYISVLDPETSEEIIRLPV